MAKTNNPDGRPKGSLNTISRVAKDNIADVFDHLGGIVAMVDWAKKNQTDFYKIYAKLLPLQVTGKDDGAIELRIIKEVYEIGEDRSKLQICEMVDSTKSEV